MVWYPPIRRRVPKYIYFTPLSMFGLPKKNGVWRRNLFSKTLSTLGVERPRAPTLFTLLCSSVIFSSVFSAPWTLHRIVYCFQVFVAQASFSNINMYIFLSRARSSVSLVATSTCLCDHARPHPHIHQEPFPNSSGPMSVPMKGCR